MSWRRRPFYAAQALTFVLFLLISLAVSEPGFYLPMAMIGCTALSIAIFYQAFGGSRAFVLGLVNFLAVYASVFAYLRDTNFAAAGDGLSALAYSLPPLGFVVGALMQRRRIRAIVTSEVMRGTRNPAALFLWLLPLAAMAVATFWVPGRQFSALTVDLVLLAAMASIGLLVAVVARDVCLFLLDSSLLFEHFYRNVARLLMPAFAFLTFYSLLVIVFAAIYRLMDRLSTVPHFALAGRPHEVSFGDALYFSLVTLATVGYGDLTPLSAAARIVVAAQVVLGILLLLFGFAEIMRFQRDKDRSQS